MTVRPHRPEDEGTVLLLTIGFAVMALALVLAVTDVSALLLSRRSLQGVADGAALSVAQDVSASGLYGDGRLLTLDGEAVLQDDAERYVRRSDLPDAGVAAAPAGADTVQVSLRRTVALPFARALEILGLDGTQEVAVTAHARLSCLGC